MGLQQLHELLSFFKMIFFVISFLSTLLCIKSSHTHSTDVSRCEKSFPRRKLNHVRLHFLSPALKNLAQYPLSLNTRNTLCS
ncbi:hypothetical protein XELAEV_18020530mg [Xenopus laevis]|uniref:Uncharacterized protein n=1 Tax=Xenopus laevis TaxID=8355 RepID=A0A974HQR0_XENLA|nr:hypothetical protein XELAEV_18020530mg [Xenopus laevis]